MNFWKKVSLKVKILSLTLGVTALLGLSAAFLVNRLATASKASILDTFGAYANSLQAAIAAQFYERYGDVQAFAVNPVMQTKNRAEITSFLNTYSAMYGIYDLIMVVDTQGNLVAVNDKGPDGRALKVEGLFNKSFSDTPWFKAASQGKFTEDKERGYAGTFVEDAHVDPTVSEVFGEPRFGTSFTAQIKDAKGDVIGVVTNRAGSRWFENEFLNLFSAMKKAGLENSELTMLSKNGTLLVDFDPKATNGSLSHNFEKIGKLNLLQMGLDLAALLKEGKEGKTISMHARKQTDQATGYMPVNDRKFIPSIGWGVIVRAEAREAFRDVAMMENVFYVSFAILSLLVAALSYIFSESLAKSLKNVAEELAGGAKAVLSHSENVASASSSLSSSATEQASSLQETVSAIAEVSAMVAKNADNAKKSQEASGVSQDAVEKGKEVVKEMIHSIGEISESNSHIMQQIEQSNREITEIVHLINEIGNKTKVINDIVFQTKLLSFNASVEAARAGEHGKGFAVVAEEVGNLASMSGNAAKEISSMLEGSIQKVEGIISNTKNEVEKLVAVGKEKVEKGTTNAERCGEVLDELVKNVSSVNQMVGEIAAASHEQAQGVGEITKAMNQLDEVTQQNATASQQCSNASEQLRTQAGSLNSIVSVLLATVQGENAANSAALSRNDPGHPGQDHSDKEQKPNRRLKIAA